MAGQNAIPGTLPFDASATQLGQTSEQLQNQGIANYNSTVPTVAATQTVSPALQTQVAETQRSKRRRA